MVVLGIDPGFCFTGYAVISKKGRVVLQDYGVLKLKSKENIPEKIKIFYEFCTELIIKWGITRIVLETSFLGKNAQTFLKLGFLRGVSYLISAQNDLEVVEFAPREIKQIITGFGGAEKEQVFRVIKMLFPNINTSTFDETDAIAIALAGALLNV